MASNYYIDKSELEKEIKISLENGVLTEKAITMFRLMVREITRTLSYKYEEDKEDCMQEAIFDVLKYWKRYDPSYPNANCFAYFSSLIINGLAKGWKKIKPISTTSLVSINDDDGIFNI